MAFDATIVHWRTLAEFTAALATINRPAFVRGIVHHNTYVPDETTWRGMASMFSMRDYYRDEKGWPSGPNLFLCAKAPNPADVGIFQMTPITRPGTHAGACNATTIGIENVGNFDRARPSHDQYTLLLDVTRLLIQAWGLPPESVRVHNECMPGRTCPGMYLTGEQIRASLSIPTPAARLYELVAPCIPLTARAPDSPLANTPPLAVGDVVQGELIAVKGWLHVSDHPRNPPGIGFVPVSYARAL